MRRGSERHTEKFISLATLAERWEASVTGARNICRRAGIPSVHLGGIRKGTVRFRLSEVERWEAAATEDHANMRGTVREGGANGLNR